MSEKQKKYWVAQCVEHNEKFHMAYVSEPSTPKSKIEECAREDAATYGGSMISVKEIKPRAGYLLTQKKSASADASGWYPKRKLDNWIKKESSTPEKFHSLREQFEWVEQFESYESFVKYNRFQNAQEVAA